MVFNPSLDNVESDRKNINQSSIEGRVAGAGDKFGSGVAVRAERIFATPWTVGNKRAHLLMSRELIGSHILLISSVEASQQA